MPPDAAQFLVQKIVSQARREGVPLTDVEEKMLLFSETSPTLPNITDVNEAFDRDYDPIAYERKIATLVRHIRSAERNNSEENRRWNEAIRALRGEDYYVLVMVNEADRGKRSSGDLIRLVLTAVVIVSVLLAIVLFFTRR